jgi:fumarate reductase subunit C
VHAPIGIRNVLFEWTPLRARACNLAAVVVGAVLLVLGLRAIVAVVLP